MTTPSYDPNPMNYPEVDESEIDSLGVGMYRVKGKHQRGDFYRPEVDDFIRDAEQVLMVRVDEGANLPLPGDAYRATYENGRRVIQMWVIA